MGQTRIVCVTACSRGLGRAMGEEFARLGWTVVGCARHPEAVAALKRGRGVIVNFSSGWGRSASPEVAP